MKVLLRDEAMDLVRRLLNRVPLSDVETARTFYSLLEERRYFEARRCYQNFSPSILRKLATIDNKSVPLSEFLISKVIGELEVNFPMKLDEESRMIILNALCAYSETNQKAAEIYYKLRKNNIFTQKLNKMSK